MSSRPLPTPAHADPEAPSESLGAPLSASLGAPLQEGAAGGEAPPSTLRTTVVLGLLTAVGPFAIDMYLPAFEAIATDLGSSMDRVQLSLTSYFAAVAIFQVLYGPISDVVGRKPPLYFGLALYVVGAVGSALVGSAEALIAFRFIQGIGGCASMVIPRAVVRDLHTGPEAAKVMSTMMLVLSVAPLLAPITGSALATPALWRWIFWLIAGIGVLGLGLAYRYLPETRARGAQPSKGPRGALRDYLWLLRQRQFMGLVFMGGMGQAAFFAYLGGSSPLFLGHYGLSPLVYSAVFALNAAFFIGGAQFTSVLMRRFGAARLLARASSIFLFLTLTLLALTLLGVDHVLLTVGLLALSFVCLGAILPATTVVALDGQGPIAGTASALLGTLRFACGAGTIAVVSLSSDGTALALVATMASCALVARLLWFPSFARGAGAADPGVASSELADTAS